MEPSVIAPPPINYAAADVQVRLPWLLRAAQWTGWTPLVVGVVTTLLWVTTRADVLPIIGLCTIAVGVPTTAAGGVCLLIYFFSNRLPDLNLRRRVNRDCGLALLVLLINYPTAYGCVALAAPLMTHH